MSKKRSGLKELGLKEAVGSEKSLGLKKGLGLKKRQKKKRLGLKKFVLPKPGETTFKIHRPVNNVMSVQEWPLNETCFEISRADLKDRTPASVRVLFGPAPADH